MLGYVAQMRPKYASKGCLEIPFNAKLQGSYYMLVSKFKCLPFDPLEDGHGGRVHHGH